MVTKKLFWEDSYATECKAKVTEINGNKVKLDQTIFFAFSGGQASDEGTIGGINVIEAVKEGDKENITDIEYTLEKAPDFKVGDEVEVKIDGDKRNKLMRLHSAIHIIYYFFKDKYGDKEVIGTNMVPEKGRIDFIFDKPLTELLPELEEEANKFFAEDHKIISESDEEKQDLRYWGCKDWKMPCGGTHIKSTKEIGKIALKRKNIGSGKERIEITLK